MFHVTILLMQDKYPIYDQTAYLNDYHKKMLKDQYGKYLSTKERITIFHFQMFDCCLHHCILFHVVTSPSSLIEPTIRFANYTR